MRTTEEYKNLSIKEFTRMMWAWNAVILPLCNLIGHGDVKAYQLHDVRQLCKNADFTIEKLEAQKGHRMHLVARKER